MNNISAFVQFHRKKLGLTQEELATKAGVGIRFVRELEQGKATLQLDKVDQVLGLFGFQLTPARQRLNPWEIRRDYFNKGVRITLFDKSVKEGIIVKEIIDKKESTISAWKFVPNKNAIQYQQKLDDNLTEAIAHADIATIENQ